MYRLDRFGRRIAGNLVRKVSPLCGASKQYAEETARRLKALARDGAAYLMLDGTNYHGLCWDPQHGHRVPAGMEEHAQANCRLARMVHEEYPHVLVEMHDPVNGGNSGRNAPIYYGHGRAPDEEEHSQASGFDIVWAFELMWAPMEDLLSGRAIALYYFNLAYELPLERHVDLRTDDQKALLFWWTASTCRQLGIGGTHKDPAVRKAHKEAMTTYRRLEQFFKAGTFYGVDEMVHVHVHPSEPAAVINCFNLDDQPVEREVEFVPEKYGLDPKRSYKVEGVSSRAQGPARVLVFKVPAAGHQLAEIRST
jgi:hypothetical protein